MSELKKLWKKRNNSARIIKAADSNDALNLIIVPILKARIRKLDKKINDIKWYRRQNRGEISREERVSAYRGY